MESSSLQLEVIRNKPTKRTMFDDCIVAQKASRDIVVYSDLAAQIVKVAWPSYHGIKIKATGIKDWLCARGLHWLCFCGMATAPGIHLSSQIVHATSGDVMVFCHYEPSTCKFFLNLSDIYESVTRTSDYSYLQKLDQLRDEACQEGADLVALRLEQLVASEVAPFLGGFCGDFVAGVEQMAGSHQYTPKSASTRIRRQSRISLPNMRSSPIPSASMSKLPAPAAPSASPSNAEKKASRLTDQRRIIAHLARGEGVKWAEWDGLVETCDVCRKTFLEANYKAHSRECWYESE